LDFAEVKYYGFKFTVLLLTLIVSGCVTTGAENYKAAELKLPKNSHFWVPPAERRSCHSNINKIFLPSEIKFSRFIFGSNDYAGERFSHEGVSFIKFIGKQVGFAVGSKNYPSNELAKIINTAAYAKAYTIPDWGSVSGDGSPNFMQSLLMVSLSYVVSYFNYKNIQYDRKAVINWGNEILEAFDDNKNALVDSYAADAVARLSWGAATQQPDIFQGGLNSFNFVGSNMTSGAFKGHAEFERVIRKLSDTSALRFNNAVISSMVVAAEAARQNGIDLYNAVYNGHTLQDAVKWHAEQSLKEVKKVISCRLPT
jgi:hypothetical protein